MSGKKDVKKKVKQTHTEAPHPDATSTAAREGPAKQKSEAAMAGKETAREANSIPQERRCCHDKSSPGLPSPLLSRRLHMANEGGREGSEKGKVNRDEIKLKRCEGRSTRQLQMSGEGKHVGR